MDHGRPAEASGETDPVTRCFAERGDRLAGTAYHVLGHREDAREAVQEAFLKCWKKRHETGAVRNLEAWIFSVVLNTARDLRRRRTVRKADSLGAEATMGSASPGLDPAHITERREALDRVRTAIQALPDHEREVFLLRQNGDLTFEAMAEALGAPVGTVKTRMRSALKRLRTAMDGIPYRVARAQGGRR
jgi:RNA polymerase sigma-70 factor, ECF subfamily